MPFSADSRIPIVFLEIVSQTIRIFPAGPNQALPMILEVSSNQNRHPDRRLPVNETVTVFHKRRNHRVRTIAESISCFPDLSAGLR
ncbi:MAG: hypothetical protein BWY82_01944 [Verrucomicrobia bacterium ADurb.Bin474]|nr:MAG: hypothetical protein BWY82_01944 [Verrucomicrobia bacterium ADurb.Bin474]